MLKFLRKYKNWILVVGGVLLMIAFLLPQALQQMGSATGDRTVMRIGDREVSAQELVDANKERKGLETVTFGFLGPYVGESDVHWLMLTHEAQRGGFIGGPSEADIMLEALARDMVVSRYAQFGLQAEQMPDFTTTVETTAKQMKDARPAAAAASSLTDAQLDAALAKVSGVMRMLNAYGQSERYSDRRAIIEARKRADAAGIEYVFISSDHTAAAVPDPDEAAIQAHIERFKNVKKGEGEFGIGYVLPARVKLAYITLDRQAILAALSPDPLEVEKRFRRKYPNGQPPADETRTPEQLRESIRAEVLNELGDQAMRTAMEGVRSEFAPLLRTLPNDGDYKRLPADWASTRPDFTKAAAAVVKRLDEAHGITIPPPAVTVRNSAWLESGELQTLPGIGESVAEIGSRREPFPMYAFEVRELAPPESAAPGLQVGVPAPEPLRDAAGNRYFFMVLDARKESNPDSWDEIRPQLVQDYKKLKAYEALAARLDAIRQKSIDEGIEAVALAEGPPADADGKVRINLPVQKADLNRSVSRLADQNIDDKTFRAAVMDAASALDPTKPLDAASAAEKTVAVAIPGRLGVAVARISSFSPLTLEDWRLRQRQIVATLQQQARQDAGGVGPYSAKELMRRHDVRFEDGRSIEEVEAEEEQAAKAG